MNVRSFFGFFKTARATRSVWAVFWTLALCGCVHLEALQHPARPVTYYSIEYPCPARLSQQPMAGVLRIKPFAVVEAFAADRIVYEDPPSSFRSPYYERWIAGPASLVAAALARDLSESGIFTAVLRSRGILEPDWEMAGTVESMKARKRDGRWETEITLHVLLYPWPKQGVEAVEPGRIFQKRYSVTAPCKDAESLSVVNAMSAGIEQLSGEMLRDLARHVGAESAAPPTSSED